MTSQKLKMPGSLEEVAKAGITMHLYERYVDDNQQSKNTNWFTSCL